MKLLDAFKNELAEDFQRTRDGVLPPGYVVSRMRRGRDRMKEGVPLRAEAISFFQSNQYVYVQDKALSQIPTTTNADGSGKPRHRVRRTFNLITPIVGHKVSQATSRMPGYRVTASNQDQANVDAARMSQKIATYGYDKWDVRSKRKEVITYALVSDEGFAMPYFNTNIGPFYEGEELGEGEICIHTYSANEVYWEPGVKFEDSRWCAVEQARPIEEVVNLPYLLKNVSLNPDAKLADSESMLATSERNPTNTKLVLVTDYFERPSAKHKRGRWITCANNQVISEPQNFPCQDNEGNVLDEPALHRLSFITDPHSDRDMGLVRHLIDAQRTFNHANNKQIEWMHLALNPQKIVKNGKLVQRANDEPGATFEFWGSGEVDWMKVPDIPPELEGIKQAVRDVMQFISADQDIPQGVEAARSIEGIIARDEGVWSDFYSSLAQFDSRLMRHCLYLVQRFYTEERIINIRGEFGPESFTAFTGAQLRGQANVTVDPDTIIPRSRQEVEQRVRYYAEMGWVAPEVAMAAINSGQAESLVNGYQLDVGRAERIIQNLKEGPEAYMGNPEIPLPSEWMPREFDNIRVHIAVFGDWMKTEDYERLPVDTRFAALTYYRGLKQLEAQQAAQEAMQRMMQARSMGMDNAGRPGESLPPNAPSPSGNGGGPGGRANAP